MAEEEEGNKSPPQEAQGVDENKNDVIGSAALRPIFLGNLNVGCKHEDIIAIFERPIVPPDADADSFRSMPVDRIDYKRGYCFVFLKDATTEDFKEMAQRFVNDINGMKVDEVSSSLRAEFARGDGRVKRKEDERRKNIEPSDTLFVVNFHEQSTRQQDLQMLFEPYGELLRVDMKRNYAFVQFKTIEQATKAKEATDGGKLDQSILTVEYVARQRNPNGNSNGRDRDRRSRGGRGDRYDDRGRGPPRGPPPPPPMYDRRGDRYDRRPDRYDDRYRDYDRPRSRSPPYRRPRSRSRSRSPSGRYGGYRSRSPPRGRYDDYGDRRSRSPPRGKYDNGPPPPPRDYRDRRSPDRDRGLPPIDRGVGGRDPYRERDRDRGYRP